MLLRTVDHKVLVPPPCSLLDWHRRILHNISGPLAMGLQLSSTFTRRGSNHSRRSNGRGPSMDTFVPSIQLGSYDTSHTHRNRTG